MRNENGLLELIEESLQSLAQRNDGTQLLTAMPYLSEVKAVFSKLSSVPNELLSLLAEWEVLGCNIVDISFVDNLKRWQSERVRRTCAAAILPEKGQKTWPVSHSQHAE